MTTHTSQPVPDGSLWPEGPLDPDEQPAVTSRTPALPLLARVTLAIVAAVTFMFAAYVSTHLTLTRAPGGPGDPSSVVVGWRGHAPGPIQCVSYYPRERTDGAPVINVNVDC